jgi:hypothetical protein
MATGTILAVFEKHVGGLNIDRKWAENLRKFTNSFITKNDNHVKFFGGHFLGVYPTHWVDQDRTDWFDDILSDNNTKVDDIGLTSDLHALDAINTDWIVSSDPYNLSCLYLLHAIHKSNLPQNLKEMAQVNVLLNLHFKFLTSLLSHRFRFASDREAEMAAFADLSKRYALKQYGSWIKLLRARCEDIISPRGIHRKTIENFRDDTAIVDMINDIQSRLRDMVNRLTSALHEALASNSKITSVSNVMTVDGAAIVKDQSRELPRYKRYIHTVISDKNSFVRPELITIVADAMHTLSVPHFVTTLEHMSECYGTKVLPFLPEFLDEVLIHAFDYISSNRLRTNDLTTIITKLRAIYMASRTSNPSLLRIKEMAHALVNSHGKERSMALAASERTAIILYVLIRTLTENYYANKTV